LYYERLSDSIDTFNRTLNGDPLDRHDLGLIGEVVTNTKFRRFMQKILWVLVLGFLTFGGYVIKDTHNTLSKIESIRQEIIKSN